MRTLLTALALALLAAAPASAQTAFGGGGVTDKGITSTSIGLLQQPDGSLTGRAAFALRCGKTSYVNLVARLRGTVAADGSFTAGGRTKVTRRGSAILGLTGTIAGGVATGEYSVSSSRLGKCEKGSRALRLRASSAPAGAPAMPAANTLLGGLTSQSAAGVVLPVFLQVSSSGRRVTGLWQATMKCGPKAVLTALNFSPPATIRPDGSFVKTEKYTIKFPRRETETYRVDFRGRFLSDGVTGTLRARMQTRQPGKRFFPCDSGTQTWSAAAA